MVSKVGNGILKEKKLAFIGGCLCHIASKPAILNHKTLVDCSVNRGFPFFVPLFWGTPNHIVFVLLVSLKNTTRGPENESHSVPKKNVLKRRPLEDSFAFCRLNFLAAFDSKLSPSGSVHPGLRRTLVDELIRGPLWGIQTTFGGNTPKKIMGRVFQHYMEPSLPFGVLGASKGPPAKKLPEYHPPTGFDTSFNSAEDQRQAACLRLTPRDRAC